MTELYEQVQTIKITASDSQGDRRMRAEPLLACTPSRAPPTPRIPSHSARQLVNDLQQQLEIDQHSQRLKASLLRMC